MYLSSKNVAFYLFERGFLSYHELLVGLISYTESGSRSLGLKVEFEGEKAFFIKQIKDNTNSMRKLLEAEAQVLQISDFTQKPNFYFYDKKYGILVSSLIKNSQNLGEYIKEHGFEIKIAHQLGKSLKAFHNIQTPKNQYFPKHLPFIFQLINKPLSKNLYQGNQHLINLLDIVFRQQNLIESIKKLSKNWQSDVLIHGDMKFENCLVETPSLSIKIIDFEEVVYADVIWDIAGIVQSAIVHQLLETKFMAFSPFSPFHPLLDDENLCLWLRDFVRFYGKIEQPKLIQLTGLRLISYLVECTQKGDITHRAHEWVPLASEMIQNPKKYLKLIQV